MFDRQQSIRRAVDVTPSDSTEIPVTRSMYFNVGGMVRVTLADMDPNASVDYLIPSGGIARPWSVKKVWAAGTTITGTGSIKAEY